MRTMMLVLIAVMPLRADEPKKPAKDSILGTWVATGGESGGTKFMADDLGGLKLTFKAKSVVWKQKGSDDLECAYTLDSGKTPKRINLGQKVPAGKKTKAGSVEVGIWKIEDGKLHLHLVPMGRGERPTEFASKAGTISTVYILERAKGK